MFQQAFIPRRLEEVTHYERDRDRLAAGGSSEGIYYQAITGMKEDLSGPRQQPLVVEQEQNLLKQQQQQGKQQQVQRGKARDVGGGSGESGPEGSAAAEESELSSRGS